MIPRIRQAPELAKEQGLAVEIETGDIDGAHPNTAASPGGRRRAQRYAFWAAAWAAAISL